MKWKIKKNYMGFLITKIWQILKRFYRALSWAQTTYFWRVYYYTEEKEEEEEVVGRSCLVVALVVASVV